MSRPSRNLAGPGKSDKNTTALPNELDRTAQRVDDYRWRGFRLYKDMKNVKTIPISKEQLEIKRCKRRTCKKQFTPTFNKQFLCNDCIEASKKRKTI